MDKQSKIYVAGHRGMVGSAVIRRLQGTGFNHIIVRSSRELDLTQQIETRAFFQSEKPDCVILAAARVGGIFANQTYRAEFIYTNLQIEANVIHSAWQAGVKRLLFFSSSCVYPRLCPQPMKETDLGSGPLEPTNEPYAMAKLAGMSMCHAYNDQYGVQFISVIPSNLYGPNDNYDPQHSHVMAALIQKFHRAKLAGSPQLTLWGTGAPRRELLFVDDVADAVTFVLQQYTGTETLNVGCGQDWTICEIAELVRRVVGFKGVINFDTSKPDGMPRKLLDTTRLQGLGWKAQTSLEEGLRKTYNCYLQTDAAGESGFFN